MKVEERAQEILGELSRLRGDFAKIQENFRVLGRHLANASGSYSETERTMTKLDAKLTQIEQPPPQKEITPAPSLPGLRSEEHTSELQSLTNLVCRLLLE